MCECVKKEKTCALSRRAHEVAGFAFFRKCALYIDIYVHVVCAHDEKEGERVIFGDRASAPVIERLSAESIARAATLLCSEWVGVNFRRALRFGAMSLYYT